MRRCGVAGVAALLLCLGAALCPARADVSLALQSYIGDETYLTNFQKNITNFPLNFWNPDLGIQPCPANNLPGFQGVTCDYVAPSGQAYTTKIDLSFGNLPPGTPQLLGTVSYDIVGLLFLSSINLKGNNFHGKLLPQLGLAPQLKNIDLFNNSLSGPLPTELCDLGLTCLNVAHNKFTGRIPPCFKSLPCVDFEGNNFTRVAGDCDATQNTSSCDPKLVAVLAPPPPPPSDSSSLSAGAIVGIVVGSLAGIALIAFLFVVLVRNQQRRRKEEERKKLAADIESQIQTRHFGTLRRFSAGELSKACNNFDEDNFLGEGGFSKVYKGKLDDGKEIAIKRIKDERKAGGELEFLNEVELISRAVHRNLMHSEGFCVEAGECMLVLPFYANGSVASRTHGKEGDPLDWLARQKIAKGAADGIAYLHTDCSPKLIHRDIKADNVLLDEGDEAIIADFGLAKEMDVKETHKTTAVKGTIGHIAPEYFVSGQCSEKTDVYAFGVFLLELVSGKDVYELVTQPDGEEVLLREWVTKVLQEGRLDEVVDGELDLEGIRVEVAEVLHVALLCIQNEAKSRPTMEDVAKLLSGKGLAEQWEKWQAEAGNMKAEDLLAVVNTPAIWDNTTTGISLEAFNISGPR